MRNRTGRVKIRCDIDLNDQTAVEWSVDSFIFKPKPERNHMIWRSRRARAFGSGFSLGQLWVGIPNAVGKGERCML